MSEAKCKHNPGDIVELGGIKFVVLDNNYGGVGDLFILALEAQGGTEFGETNDYAESKLGSEVWDWYLDFAVRLDLAQASRIKFRTLDLTTLDGHGHYDSFRTKAAPLTLDEARRYADMIPPCDGPWWLATGWGGPEYFRSAYALYVGTNGNWCDSDCGASTYGIRPALVIDPALLDETPDQDAPQIPDLSGCSTDDLLAEIRRRMED